MQTWILGFYLREFFSQSLFDSGLALDINYLSLEIALSIVSNHCLPSLLVEKSNLWCDLIYFFQVQSLRHRASTMRSEITAWWTIWSDFSIFICSLSYLKLEKGSDVNYMWASIWWNEAWKWILRYYFRLDRLGNVVATNTTTILMVNQNSVIFSQANLLLAQASLQGFSTWGARIPGHFYLMVLLYQYRVSGFV